MLSYARCLWPTHVGQACMVTGGGDKVGVGRKVDMLVVVWNWCKTMCDQKEYHFALRRSSFYLSSPKLSIITYVQVYMGLPRIVCGIPRHLCQAGQ